MAEAAGYGNRLPVLLPLLLSVWVTSSGARRSASTTIRAAQRGANTMTTWRPSKRGSCSILAILTVSPLTRSKSL